MAKINTCITRCVVLFLFCFLPVFTIPQDGPDATVLKIKKEYTKLVGVKEKTGNNDGEKVKEILATVGLPEGYPWCAAAVKYTLLKANITSAKRINGMALSCENKSAIVYKSRSWFGNFLPGDVFTLYYPRLKRIGHTGFVDRIANKEYGTVVTYEGNTNGMGSRDGDGFYIRIRQVASIHSISRWR